MVSTRIIVLSSCKDDDKVWEKSCEICTDEAREGIVHLPLFMTMIDDEQHLLATCLKYHHPRFGLPDVYQ